MSFKIYEFSCHWVRWFLLSNMPFSILSLISFPIPLCFNSKKKEIHFLFSYQVCCCRFSEFIAGGTGECCGNRESTNMASLLRQLTLTVCWGQLFGSLSSWSSLMVSVTTVAPSSASRSADCELIGAPSHRAVTWSENTIMIGFHKTSFDSSVSQTNDDFPIFLNRNSRSAEDQFPLTQSSMFCSWEHRRDRWSAYLQDIGLWLCPYILILIKHKTEVFRDKSSPFRLVSETSTQYLWDLDGEPSVQVTDMKMVLMGQSASSMSSWRWRRSNVRWVEEHNWQNGLAVSRKT